MDKVQLTTLKQQISKLKERLNIDASDINLIDKISLGLLNVDIQAIWWGSEGSFLNNPNPLLQDELSIYAQRTWQRWRTQPPMLALLFDSINIYHHPEVTYQWDLKLHQQYPELSLVKYWLASVNVTHREVHTNQADLWFKHLKLTHSLLLAQHQQTLNPGCLVGYAENRVVIVDLEKRKCVIASQDAFATFQSSGITFIHYPYPT